MAIDQGTRENPWTLKTPPLSSDFTMYKDLKEGRFSQKQLNEK